MIRLIIVICVLLTFFTENTVWADSASVLKKRISKIHYLHANFKQKIIDTNGNLIQKSQGEMWIKYPSLLNWHTIKPNESILISDGESLWFYNPFLEQVTVTWLKDSINNTPLFIFIKNKLDNFYKYNIKQNKDNFLLIPRNRVGNLKKINIKINQEGIIYEFSIIEQDNQINKFELECHQNNAIDESKFIFKLPKNVTLDDQRF